MLYQILLLIIIIIAGIFLLFEVKRLIVRLYITLQGPFFAPTSHERVEQVIKLAKLKKGMKIADLGSGDGRILIGLVKNHPDVTATGIELDPKYVKLATKNVEKAGLSDRIKIRHASFWEVNLSEFDVITMYCVQRFMGKLEKKLKKEIKKSCRVISVFFQFPTWSPTEKLGDIRLYRK